MERPSARKGSLNRGLTASISNLFSRSSQKRSSASVIKEALSVSSRNEVPQNLSELKEVREKLIKDYKLYTNLLQGYMKKPPINVDVPDLRQREERLQHLQERNKEIYDIEQELTRISTLLDKLDSGLGVDVPQKYLSNSEYDGGQRIKRKTRKRKTPLKKNTRRRRKNLTKLYKK